jgi:H+/Cl- antiporter ClcA
MVHKHSLTVDRMSLFWIPCHLRAMRRVASDPVQSAAAENRRRLSHLRRLWYRHGILWLGSITVGVSAVGYAYVIDLGYRLFSEAISGRAWLPLVVTPIIGGISVWLTRTFFPGAEGSGIPQVIAVLHDPSGDDDSRLLRIKIALGKVAVSFLAILGGFTIGREGPTVHVGAAIMYSLRRLYPERLRGIAQRALERRLILAGAASGLAAAFNTPLAGIVFAIEELSRGFETRAARVTVIAIILSGLVALSINGNYTYFGSFTIGEISVWTTTIAVVISGGLTGLAGGMFAWVSLNVEKWLPKYAVSFRRRRPVMFGVACGVVVALIGFASGGHTYGSGYAEARSLVEGHASLSVSYSIEKCLSLIASYLAGAPGGIFAPSLAIGAGIGQNIHELVTQVPPQIAIALAMVGYLAAVTQSPITSFIIVTEMGNAHVLIIPLMATALIASTVSKAFGPPLYEALALRYMR